MRNFFLGALVGPFVWAFAMLALGVNAEQPAEEIPPPQVSIKGPWMCITIDAHPLELRNTLNVLHNNGYWVRKIIDRKTTYIVVAINKRS